MAPTRRVHDRELLDALEALDPISLTADVWRAVRIGRDPIRGSTADGRWGAAGELEVLYTSLERDGARAEIGYRLGLEPVWPSRLEHTECRVSLELERVCDLTDFALLSALGVDEGRYEGHDYRSEQAISAAARFLNFDGILVPNARHPSDNLVIYTDVVDSGALNVHEVHKIDWNRWRAANRTRPSRRRGR
jgi:hypothetical protein